MLPDDHVCLCHKVSLRKLRVFLKQTKPKSPSQLSECLGAGTACGWCISALEKLHSQHCSNKELRINCSFKNYKKKRTEWKKIKKTN